MGSLPSELRVEGPPLLPPCPPPAQLSSALAPDSGASDGKEAWLTPVRVRKNHRFDYMDICLCFLIHCLGLL